MPTRSLSSRRRPTVIVAVDDAFVASWLVFAVRGLGLRAVLVADPGAVFDAVARRAPAAIVLGEQVRGVPAEAVVAMTRSAGSRVPALVVGPFDGGTLRVATRALQPVAWLADPTDGVALAATLRDLLVAAREPVVSLSYAEAGVATS